MSRFLLGFFLSLVASAALAQGCGPTNPNCVVPDRPAGDISNAAADTRFVSQNTLPSVLVTAPPFNALCNGTGDDSAAINAAINSFPLPGAGIVLFPSNANCRITSSINLGNGTSSSASTRQGVILRGVGNPNTAPIFPGFTATSGPKITWAGSGANAIIAVNGPLQAWGIESLYLDCANIALSIGVNVVSAQNGETRNLSLINCAKGYASTAFAPFGSLTNTNSQHNKHYNTTVQVPAIANAIGIILTGVTTADTDFETWVGTDIFLPISVVVVNGWQLQATESHTIINTHFYGGNPSANSVVFDYSINSQWPSAVNFYGIDPFQSGGGAQFTNGGTTPGASRSNIVILSTSNSASCAAANIPNVSCFSGQQLNFSPGGNVANTVFPPPAWTTFTPTPTCTGGTFTTNAAKSYTIGKITYITFDITVATGPCSTPITFTLPNTANTSGGFAGNNSNSGDTAGCRVGAGSATATCQNGVGSNFVANDRLFVSGVYENQ